MNLKKDKIEKACAYFMMQFVIEENIKLIKGGDNDTGTTNKKI